MNAVKKNPISLRLKLESPDKLYTASVLEQFLLSKNLFVFFFLCSFSPLDNRVRRKEPGLKKNTITFFLYDK